MHLDYNKQLAIKAQLLQEILKHQGIDWQGEVIASPKQKNYRFKANLKLEKGVIGFNRRHSEEVIKIPECEILAKPILEAIPKIKIKNLLMGDIPLLASRKTGQVAGMIQTTRNQHSLPSFHFAVSEDYGFGSMELLAANFVQANPYVTELMLEEIHQASQKSEFAVEIYAGSGTLTLSLAKAVSKVLAFEGNDKAVKRLLLNLEQQGVNNVECKSEKDEKSKIPPEADLILVDPPRGGIDRMLIERIIQSQASKIIYMSCNPATQARDLKLLIEKGGFRLEWLKAYDMYCHSSHLETLALLVRQEIK